MLLGITDVLTLYKPLPLLGVPEGYFQMAQPSEDFGLCRFSKGFQLASHIERFFIPRSLHLCAPLDI
jgi:hypothetical protein